MRNLLKRLKLLFGMTVILLATCSPVQASVRSDALKAYKKMLSQTNFPWEAGSGTKYIKGSTLNFRLAYVDNNNVPELFLEGTENPHAYGWFCMYTYVNGKVILCDMNDCGYTYFKKRGVFRTGFVHSSVEEYSYMRLKKGTGSNIASKNVIWSRYSGKSSPEYTNASDKVISKKKFKKLLKKYVRSRKEKTVKINIANTASNRKKYLG